MASRINNAKLVINYARAFFAFLSENLNEQLVASLLENLWILESTIKNDRILNNFFRLDHIPKNEKHMMIKKIGEILNLDKFSVNFLLLLVKNNRLSLLSKILPKIEELLNRHNKLKYVSITYANQLSSDLRNFIKEKLSNSLGCEIKISDNKDESIIDGVVIKYDNCLIDYSILNMINLTNIKMKKSVIEIVECDLLNNDKEANL